MQHANGGKRSVLQKLILNEDINFLVTNRIPRRMATRLMGWYSKIQNKTLTRGSIAIWRRFAPDLDLSEASKNRFDSLHDCFVRELRPGSRPIDTDPKVVTSPCDAIVGAHGDVEDGRAFQAKGFPYSIRDLLCDDSLVQRYRNGKFVTLRLKSSFYHRFHAPCDGALHRVTYVSGDTWNVNPIACKRIENLFCKNERAVLDLEIPADAVHVTLVPVAAILVASIRLHCLPSLLDLRYRGPNDIACNATFTKGDELGWFEHGSTILVFASSELSFADHIQSGTRVRVGEPLFHSPVSLQRSSDPS
ncbi:MAG: phosphatidylserine decarboxylase [Planctomycetes bacterium]|nr:phosphatidylserine decarboxylase [Planctomycetota bacterium]